MGKNSPKAIRQTVRNQKALSIPKTGTKRRVELEDDESDVHVIPTRKKGLPAKLEKSIVVEIVCIPKDTVVIPRGQYRKQLEDKGHIKYLRYKKAIQKTSLEPTSFRYFPVRLKLVLKVSFSWMHVLNTLRRLLGHQMITQNGMDMQLQH